ncbi:MAG: hypothetical protein ACI9CA_000693 [Natronomonas sp.]|jgi:hypothetical protein
MSPPTPDLWAVLLFFGLPFVAGLLGLRTGGLWCLRAYRRRQGTEPAAAPGDLSGVDLDPELDGDLGRAAAGPRRSAREQAVVGTLLVAGSALLLAHSGRWLLQLL